jgi:hypothetical protein
MQANNTGNTKNRKKLKTGDQRTLDGQRAFDPLQDCQVCKAKKWGREVHRAHHPLCWNNRRTKGITSEVTLESIAHAEKLRKHFSAQLSAKEKYSSANITQAVGEKFFAPRKKTSVVGSKSAPTLAVTMETTTEQTVDNELLYHEVVAKLNNGEFCKEHANNRAPLAMIALAGVVVERVINKNNGSLIPSFFTDMTMTVPAVATAEPNPHYHSIVGQKLLLVDWLKIFKVNVPCPCCQEQVPLKNDRTHFSKNKILFPIFGLDGPPQWCMVMSMKCPSCKARFDANDSVILCHLPPHIATAYPVEPKYAASNRNSHISRSATDVFDMLLPTYGNGDLCSRMLYNAMNRAYIVKVASYYSCLAENRQAMDTASIVPYIEKDGYFITCYPPLGDTIRDIYDEACTTSNNPWLISDHDRHTREMQAVDCHSIFAQDHTHEVTKNYFNKKKLGAVALWDVATESGEIACAVLVPSTKTTDFSHAAKQLSNRQGFRPKAMYSDTWPCKSDYWSMLLGENIQGRLGLFHFIQRIMRTLRKNHADYNQAINSLLNAVYVYNQDDYESLLCALKAGTVSNTKYDDDDIAYMKSTKTFRKRYDKYLRKEIRPPNSMRAKLDEWFDRFKCSTSSQARPARGRLDPITQQSLFTEDTKGAWTNCKEKAEFLQDPLPLEEMYATILPHPDSPHGLKEYLSRRGESCLEAFHLLLAHFANCGMRNSLADNLNLTGTCRYNLSIRHKLRLSSKSAFGIDFNTRRKMPSGWEGVVPYFNHSELNWINQLAIKAGSNKVPFHVVEPLRPDSGERFFSEYLVWLNSTRPKFNAQDCCLCQECGGTAHPPLPSTLLRMPMEDETIADTMPATTVTAISTAAPASMQSTPFFQTPVMFPYYPPLLPLPVPGFPAMPPWLSVVQQPQYCCQRYREWYNRNNRMGRPPHEFNCRGGPKVVRVQKG